MQTFLKLDNVSYFSGDFNSSIVDYVEVEIQKSVGGNRESSRGSKKKRREEVGMIKGSRSRDEREVGEENRRRWTRQKLCMADRKAFPELSGKPGQGSGVACSGGK